MKRLTQFQSEGRGDVRPSAIQSTGIIEKIVSKFGLKYVAHHFRVSHQSVAGWLEDANNPLTHVRDLLRDLRDEGCREIAIEVLRYLCSSIRCVPADLPETKITISTLLQSFSQHGRESADVQIAFSNMAGDLVAESDEIEREIREIDEQIEAAVSLRSVMIELLSEAKNNGGRVVLDLSQKIVSGGGV